MCCVLLTTLSKFLTFASVCASTSELTVCKLDGVQHIPWFDYWYWLAGDCTRQLRVDITGYTIEITAAVWNKAEPSWCMFVLPSWNIDYYHWMFLRFPCRQIPWLFTDFVCRVLQNKSNMIWNFLSRFHTCNLSMNNRRTSSIDTSSRFCL